MLLLPLLIPRLPAKGVNAGLFFVAFPVVAFFLLRGGGLDGFGVSWTASLLSGFADSIGEAGSPCWYWRRRGRKKCSRWIAAAVSGMADGRSRRGPLFLICAA